MKTYTKRFFKCDCWRPEEFEVEHLLVKGKNSGHWGPWRCGGCGHFWKGTANDDYLTAEKIPERRDGIYPVLLKLTVPATQLVFVATHVHDSRKPIDLDGITYLFESHQCPTNTLSSIQFVGVWEYGQLDDDAHGLFQVVDIGTEELPNPDSQEFDKAVKKYLLPLLKH